MQEIMNALRNIPAGDDLTVVIEGDVVRVMNDATGEVVNDREARLVRRNGKLEIHVYQTGKILTILPIKTYSAFDTAQSILDLILENDDEI